MLRPLPYGLKLKCLMCLFPILWKQQSIHALWLTWEQPSLKSLGHGL